MKNYEVYLFRAPGCIRGWLPYLKQSSRPCTVIVKVTAETGAKAKNAAVTAANNAFRGVKIVGKNYDDPLWGLDLFPDVKANVEAAESAGCRRRSQRATCVDGAGQHDERHDKNRAADDY